MARTVVVVWGYGEPENPFFASSSGSTEPGDFGAALRRNQFATSRGWESRREDAWVREITLPLSPPAALQKVREEALSDPTIAGWQDFMTDE